MAKILVNRRHKTYRILEQSILGPGRDYFHLTSVVASGATPSANLTFQATLIQSAELVKLEQIHDSAAPLSEEELQLLSQYKWSRAPSWANYAAVNEDGTGNWFAAEPILDEYRGKWQFDYSDRRSWPMYSTVRLFRSWRDSLRQRPVGNVIDTNPLKPEVCPKQGTDIVTDAIGYIEATLGNIEVLPECTWPNCDCASTSAPATDTPQEAQPLSAVVVIEVSNDGLQWLSLGTITLSESTPTEGFSSQSSWAYVRARLQGISGVDAFVTVTMGV